MPFNTSFLTPKQKEIQEIINTRTILESEAEELLICLSNMNEEIKSTLHYHSSPYLKYLISCNDDIIDKLKKPYNL